VRSLHGVAEEAEHQIDIVAAVAEELTAAETVGDSPSPVRVAYIKIYTCKLFCPDRHLYGLTVFSRVKKLLELYNAGPESYGISAHKCYALLLARLYKVEAFFFTVTHRLFHKHMLFVSCEEHSALIVQIVGKCYKYTVNIIYKVTVVGYYFRRVAESIVYLLSVLGNYVADSNDLDIGQFVYALYVISHHFAAAYKT
jgi:hypothetical protein